MNQVKNSFLGSSARIHKNQAEYSILNKLFLSTTEKSFILEFKNLSSLLTDYSKIIAYINQEYKAFNIKHFMIKDEYNCNTTKLKVNTKQPEDIINFASILSRKSNNFFFIKYGEDSWLYYQGNLDSGYTNSLKNQSVFDELLNKKKGIDQIEEVFENFQINRKHNGCDYVENGKVRSDISEQTLRNHLIDFLQNETNLYVIPEFCTALDNDEESVDIALFNMNNLAVIIEVKYFVERKLYTSTPKTRYSFFRFGHGYEQINKYCIHLNDKPTKIHSAFLYMFYAHTEPLEYIKTKAKEYYDNFIETDSCNELFHMYYKDTIYDNILLSKDVAT